MPDKKDGASRINETTLERLFNLTNPILAVIIAFIMGGFMVLLSGDNPLTTYSVILKGAFGSLKGIENTIKFSIPMVLLAFSFSICSLGGYFNIGQEAQVYGSAIVIGFVSQYTQMLPLWLRMVMMIVCACLAGAVICIIPALAKFKLGASEIVVGVMLNYIMVSMLDHLLKYSVIGDPTKSTLMSNPIQGSISLGTQIIIVLAIVIAYLIILKLTIPGYRLQVIGKNPKFAEASGLPSMRIIFRSAILGGILSGLVACGEIFGNYNFIYSQFAANYGNNGMIVALIGSGNPIGMLFGSVMLGTLRSGSSLLNVVTNVPSEIVECVQGFVIFFASANIIRRSVKWKNKRALKGGD